MPGQVDGAVRAATAGSELLRAVASVRADGGRAFALGADPVRPLRKVEIDLLVEAGNTARDWARVLVADGFNPRRVRGCEFHGDVVLGQFREYATLADGVEVPTGLTRSTIANSVVGHDAVVRDVRLLANTVVGAGAVVSDCGRVTCAAGATFGTGTAVPVALEGGGREVEVYAEIDVGVAAAVARRGLPPGELDAYRRAVAEYAARATSDRGIVGPGAVVRGTPRVEDTYIGPHAVVDGAQCVVGSALLGDADVPTRVESGAVVRGSVVQWGGRVADHAVVERSVVCECATADRHAKVSGSILGPNTTVGSGEVVSALLGPFVTARHQSLVIATYWPGGRGNVGAGANVGSNHTSRAPDQEFRAGEGLFLGLGVNVKFPCDFGRAPYTVVACGVTLPSQRVAFPFALIVQPRDRRPAAPAGHNEIVPAWGLIENPYALWRAEEKFRARDRATRTRMDYAVLRRETVELMRAAGRLLEDVSVVKECYTERDIPGLGMNVLREADRVRAIEAYRFYTRYYALRGLLAHAGRLADQGLGGRLEALLATPGDEDPWEFQRRVLVEDGEVAGAADGLARLPDMLDRVAAAVAECRARDHARGGKVIDGYEAAHVPTHRDRVVRAVAEEAAGVRTQVEALLEVFAGQPSGAGIRAVAAH